MVPESAHPTLISLPRTVSGDSVPPVKPITESAASALLVIPTSRRTISRPPSGETIAEIGDDASRSRLSCVNAPLIASLKSSAHTSKSVVPSSITRLRPSPVTPNPVLVPW